MQVTIGNARIQGVACALPPREVFNLDIQEFSREEIQKTIALTGVYSRRVAAEGVTAADLCESASRRLLDRLNWAPDSVDGLIFVTQTPDFRLPATACILQNRLGISNGAACFDVNLGCSGYPYGLWLAASVLNAHGARRILLLAGETPSKIVSPNDRSVALLFGDAGSATAIEYEHGCPPMTFVLGTDGAGWKDLVVPDGGFRNLLAESFGPDLTDLFNCRDRRSTDIYMNGEEVFSFTLKTVPNLIRQILDAAALTDDAVDTYALHQANAFMLSHLIKRLKFPAEKFPSNIGKFGNTSSVSIPLLLCSELGKQLQCERSSVVMAGFGVGLSWAAAHAYLGALGCAEVLDI
jgi:3-oxoacyl-[acyl-carrier-protein] synthase-3